MPNLLATHPRLGLAAFGHRWEQDKTGEYPGRFCEIVHHDHDTGRCRHCNGTKDRHAIVDRLLVSPNAGHVRYVHYATCRECGAGVLLSA